MLVVCSHNCSMTFSSDYIGRFAPSPTGDMHLGNLQTALLAWLHARLNKGRMLLRIEDLDTPRVVQGSDQQIIRDLEWLGLDWDGTIEYQSQRLALYEGAVNQLHALGLLYPCFCSRKDIREAASAPHPDTKQHTKLPSHVYPQTCRGLSQAEIASASLRKPPALRLKTNASDLLQDDFVVKRADGLFAYQLAVIVDDLDQCVSHVVRGADLAASRFNQLQLARHLQPSRQPIEYLHAPLLLDEQGERMSKRDGSNSLKVLQSQGAVPEAVIALIAAPLGLIETTCTLISARDLLNCVSLPQVEQLLAP